MYSFIPKNKFEKLVHLVDFSIRKSTVLSHWAETKRWIT